jgi:hypothetical protein
MNATMRVVAVYPEFLRRKAAMDEELDEALRAFRTPNASTHSHHHLNI